MNAAVLLWLAAMIAEPRSLIAEFDFAIINHVRTYTVEFDRWGRPTWTPHLTAWVSFYDFVTLPRGLIVPSVPVAWINRGWWTVSQTRSILPCSDGWLLDSTDRVTVVATAVYLVESDYDWEMRHRKWFDPIRKP